VQNVTIKMKSKKLYWKGIEQLNSESTIVEGLENNEFVEKLPVNSKEESSSLSVVTSNVDVEGHASFVVYSTL